MDLIIYTGATDISQAAVTAIASTTAVDELKQLVIGDDEPLTVQFTTGTAAPAWASDATYVLTVCLGVPTPSGLEDLATTSSFTLASSTRTGSLDLTGTALTDYARTHLGSYPGRRYNLGMVLQVRIATPASKNITYAQLPVIVQCQVIEVA